MHALWCAFSMEIQKGRAKLRVVTWVRGCAAAVLRFQGTIVTPIRALGHSGMCLQNVNGLRIFLDQIVQSLGLLFKRLGADIGKPY